MAKGVGVSFYKTGYVNWAVHFPDGVVSCANCAFAYRDSMQRCICTFTHRICFAPAEEVEPGCPIVFTEDEL